MSRPRCSFQALRSSQARRACHARPGLLATLAFAAAALAAPVPAQAQSDDARAEAGAAFKRAVAAEARADWRGAIREYEAAYQLSPHPDVLFNIAADYAQLRELRTAATYYQRYLDAKPTASDRAKVEALLAELRARPATLTVTARPAGATIIVDGEPRGRAPRAVIVPGGTHQVVAEVDGARASRVVIVEYGEAQAIELAVVAGTGTLAVTANAPGASVTIDGTYVGTAPWTGPVAAGPHTVVLAAKGFTTVERQVEVPADGSAQIRGAMGRPLEAPEPEAATLGGKLAGISGGIYLGTAVLGGFSAGTRGQSGRYDATIGIDYGAAAVAWTLRLRGYLLTGPIRPYAVAAVTYGSLSGGYLGAGLAVPLARHGVAQPELSIESGYGAIVAPDHSGAVIPIIVGLQLRYGR
ncbi:MAG: PEGA domain-containing protein [Kofleriaceae bacterium]